MIRIEACYGKHSHTILSLISCTFRCLHWQQTQTEWPASGTITFTDLTSLSQYRKVNYFRVEIRILDTRSWNIMSNVIVYAP